MRIVVVGGGIAGLVAAHAAAQIPGAQVTLLEREPQLMAHASGRNAAIYRPLEAPRVVSQLALASAPRLDALCGGRDAWLRPVGLLLTARDGAALARLQAIAAEIGVAATLEDGAAIARRVSVLAGGSARAGLWLPSAGVLDGHGIASALAAAIRAAGGTIVLGRTAEFIEPAVGAALRVTSGDAKLLADAVVVAGGAWAGEVGARCGAPLPLTPMRRHLVMLEAAEALLAPDAPTVWDVQLGCYFRAESGAVLASPGDATAWPPGEPPTDPDALGLLAERLGALAPALAGARVRRSWACLRTFAPDHAAVVGADPRVRGLYWLAGLGGHGMSAALGAGEVLGDALAGRVHPLAAELAPARIVVDAYIEPSRPRRVT